MGNQPVMLYSVTYPGFIVPMFQPCGSTAEATELQYVLTWIWEICYVGPYLQNISGPTLLSKLHNALTLVEPLQ